MNLSPLSQPATVNPNLLAQGRSALANAQARDVNSLPDPKTYAFVSGLMGTPPDQQGFSVFKPNLEGIKSAGEVGYGLGLGAQALPFMGAAAKAAPALGRELAGTAVDRMMAGQSMVPGVPASMVNPPMTSIIKQGGGNWVDKYHPGNIGIDTNVDSLKIPVPFGQDRATMEHNLRAIAGAGDVQIQDAHNALKINEWVDKKLKPYVRNQMGTPNDPVRAQADTANILHMPFSEELARVNKMSDFHKHMREQGGFPREGVATSDLGKQWEYLTDSALNNNYLMNLKNPRFYNDPDSILKLDPSTNINYIKDPERFNKLGFGHMIDVLSEKVNAGEIPHKDLDKLSVAGAVKHTYDYDEKMRAAMAKAAREDLQHANIAHKTDEGVVVKLDKPGQFAKESDNMGHSVRGYEPPEGHVDYIKASGNKGSRSYGHGGWEAIKSGKAEVYSVRDFDNKPYATVETLQDKHPIGYSTQGQQTFPNDFEYNYKRLPQEQHQAVYNRAKQIFDGLEYESPSSVMDSFQQAADEVIGKGSKNITQIKGPVNQDVSYKPAQTLKDFLNSRKWGRVNEIDKANLIDLEDEISVYNSLHDVLGDYKLPHERQEAFRDATAANPDVQRFMNRQEFKDFVDPPKQEPTRDQNLTKFLEPSIDKKVYYHKYAAGDNKEPVEIDTLRPGSGKTGTNAINLTPDREFANNFTNSLSFYKPINETSVQGIGEAIYPVHVQVKNPFDYENPEHIKLLEDKLKNDKFTVSLYPTVKTKGLKALHENVKASNRGDNWTEIENYQTQKHIRDLGFDGYYMREKGIKNLAVYKPNQVKSVHGNEGTYDVNNELMHKAEGGRVKRNVEKAPSMKMSLLDAIKKHYPEGLNDAMKKINKSTAPKKKTLKIDDMRYALMKGK
jgi:hypothetical protein